MRLNIRLRRSGASGSGVFRHARRSAPDKRGTRLRSRIAALAASVIVAGSGLGGLLAILLPTTAHAADPQAQYTLYFPNNKKTIDELSAAAHDGGIGTDDINGVLSQTYVMTKGSPLGVAELPLNATNSNGEDLPTYSADYYCSPTNNYQMSTTQPSNNQPWIRYTLAVALNDWRTNFPHDATYDTYAGFYGNTYIGSVHWPPETKDNSNMPGADISIQGAGGDHNIRTGLSSDQWSSTGPGVYQFNDYDKSLPANNLTVAQKCMIQPIGHVHTAVVTSNYNKLSKADQQAWDQAINKAGLGKDVGSVGPGAGAVSSGTLTCDFSSSPLSWIICPVVDLMVQAIGATDHIITDQMVIPQNQIFCSGSNTCQDYYSAWASFRDIALGLLVAAGLIVIIAQAVGMEILDAYTIRKVLPRLLIAAIAITLSWTLMNFAVELANNLGYGVRNLIIAPFKNIPSVIDLNFSSDAIANFFGGAGAAGVAVVAAVPIWIAFGGIGVLLSYVATAGLAVLIALLVLMLRQVVIILLMILSPIALIAYVLPNTQRVFHLWWESFSKALLMFPLIAGLIAAGRVFAAISLQQGDAIHGILGFISYFAPYFMIPMTFRMSGGIMSGMGNFINQRAQGAQSALSGFRSNQRQNRVARARAKGLYRPGLKPKIPFTNKKIPLGNMLNKAGFWTINADEMLPLWAGTTKLGKGIDGKQGIPGFRRGGQALRSRILRAGRDQTVKALQDLDIGYKSGRLMGGEFQYYTEGLTAEGHKQLMDRYGIVDSEGKFQGYRAPENWAEREDVANIFTNQSKGLNPETGQWDAKGIEAREAGGELMATASEFEKYTASPETNYTDGRLLGLLAAAKAGRLEMGEVAANYNRHYDAGDQETALRETTLLQDYLTPKRVSAARGHSLWWDDQGHAHSSYEDPTSEKAQTSLMRINTQEIAASKSEDIDALHDTLVAGASDYDMEFKDGKLGVKMVGGKPKPKDKDSVAGRRKQEIRGRIKTLAMYNSGDSDVGRKIRDIWVDELKLPESDLDWGAARRGSGHTTDPREVELAGLMGGAGAGAAPGAEGEGPGGGPPTPR